jgi:uncharacterized protein (DUF433 family)
MSWHDHIVRDPNICSGQPTIRGTRVLLRTILASLAKGMEPDQIREHHPTISDDDMRAVIAFAATAAEEVIPTPTVPDV